MRSLSLISGIFVCLTQSACSSSRNASTASFSADTAQTMSVSDIYADVAGLNPNNVAVNRGGMFSALGKLNFAKLATSYQVDAAAGTLRIDGITFAQLASKLSAASAVFAAMDSRYASLSGFWQAANFDPDAVPSLATLRSSLQGAATVLQAPLPAVKGATSVLPCNVDLSSTAPGLTTAVAGADVALYQPAFGRPLMLGGLLAASSAAALAAESCPSK